METQTCKTCDLAISGPYCPQCGQRHRDERITVRFLGIELFHIITNLERGLWHTIIGLLRNPGHVIREYLRGATALYYQPLRYLLLMAGFSALLSSFVDFDKVMDMAISSVGVEMAPEQRAMQIKMSHIMLRYTNVLISLGVPLFSVGSYLAYRKYQYTYAEHLVANAYLYGSLSIVSVVTVWFTANPSLFIIATGLSNFATLLFNFWFFKSWHQIKWRTAIWRSLLGLVISLLVIGVFGNIITLVLMAAGILPKMH